MSGGAWLAAGVAALHYLALGIGLGAVFMRGRYLRERDVARVLAADNFWGVSALLWIATGVARAFGGLEKGTHFYTHSPMFLFKMALFALVFVIELKPMMTFVKWRIAKVGEQDIALDDAGWAKLIRINDCELGLVVLIPLVASMMARGVGGVLGE